MATNLNLDSLNVDSTGRASFSGLASGIDLQGTVDALIAVKRLPVDRIEQRISDNQAKIAAFEDMRSLALNLRTAVETLRGAVSFDNSGDIFEAKQGFATTSRADAATPSEAATLLGVTLTNQAQATNHTIEILQTATAHKIASDAVMGALDDAVGLSGTFEINGRAITIDGGDNLLELREKINAANSGDSASGVTASIVSLSETEHILILTADDTGTDSVITVADTSGSVLESLGVLDTGAIKNQLQDGLNARLQVDGLSTVIERQSNTIDDIFEGVTLSLFKAEVDTTIKLDVERDLNQVKSAIVDTVDAYNELRSFINVQAVTTENADDDETTGILAGSSALSEVRARLSGGISTAAAANDPTFAVLAEIGITIQGPGAVADPLLANTLAIDETKLDEALLNQADAVRELFAFELSSSSSDVVLIGFDGNTSFNDTGYKLNVAYAGGEIVSANIDGLADGSDDGSVTVNGSLLTVNEGGAQGLQVFYTGTASASDIQLDISVGVGANLYHTLDALVDQTSGLIANEIDALEGQNETSEVRVDNLNERLERERERLLERFAAMETALATMNRLLDSLRQQIDSIFNNDR